MGIIVHAGGLNFGHYYSICYNMVDERWRIYNDENLPYIETKNIFNKNPYCLFLYTLLRNRFYCRTRWGIAK